MEGGASKSFDWTCDPFRYRKMPFPMLTPSFFKSRIGTKYIHTLVYNKDITQIGHSMFSVEAVKSNIFRLSFESIQNGSSGRFK